VTSAATPTRLAFPITPSGASSILDLWTEPSQRVVGNALWISFESDPAVVREFVPEPLELDGSGLVYLYAFDGYGYTDRNTTEFVSAERINFTEAMFWIPCTLNGEPYAYKPFTWVNRDFLAYYGRLLGMPQKWGKVQMTPLHPADPIYNEPHEGVRIALSVENVGLVLRAYVDLGEPADQMPVPMGDDESPGFVGHRHFYDVVTGDLAIDDLVVHWAHGMKLGPIWRGDAWLQFYEAENEEAIRFQPQRMVGGWYVTISFSHDSGPGRRPEVLHDFKAAGR
jgi:hypothetical protein